jgi:hypothetical protein
MVPRRNTYFDSFRVRLNRYEHRFLQHCPESRKGLGKLATRKRLQAFCEFRFLQIRQGEWNSRQSVTQFGNFGITPDVKLQRRK